MKTQADACRTVLLEDPKGTNAVLAERASKIVGFHIHPDRISMYRNKLKKSGLLTTRNKKYKDAPKEDDLLTNNHAINTKLVHVDKLSFEQTLKTMVGLIDQHGGPTIHSIVDLLEQVRDS